MESSTNVQINRACVAHPVQKDEDWQAVLPLIQEQLHSEQLELEPDQLLYQAGTAARDLFILNAGRVQLFKILPNGQQHMLRLAQAGDVFGFDGLVDHFYNHSAQAVTAVTVCRIAIQHLQALSSHYPQLERLLMVRCLRDLQHADERRLIQVA